MSQARVYCSANTYISMHSPSVDHSTAVKLVTSSAGSFDIGGSSIQNALLQFALPNSVLYKKISKVILNYYIGSDGASYGVRSIYYTPYITEAGADEIRYSTVKALGALGERKQDTTATYLNSWVSEDITDIFVNNVTKGIFSLFISAGESSSAEDQYAYTYVGGIGGNVAYLEVEYEDVTPIPPTISYPDGVYIREGEKVLFSWVYNSATEATQEKVSLEWRKSGTESWTAIMLEQTAQSYVCDAIFTQGTYEWRLNTTNNAGETSEYAYASFIIIGKPAVPVITNIENKALTTIEWNAADQCACEITLLSGETEIIHEMIYTGKMRYKPNIFLENGTYTVKLRTKNSIELWSDVTSKTFTITAEEPVKPILILRQVGRNIILDISHNGAKVAVMRDEKVIAVLGEDVESFTDSTVVSGRLYTYKARAFADGYKDSDAKSGMVRFEGFELRAGEDTLICCTSENQFLKYSEKREKEKALMKYVGREYPVLEVGEAREQRIQRNVYLTEKEYEILKNIGDREAWYRDDRGNSFLCTIDYSVTKYMDKGYTVDIEVIRIDENEVILNA